MRYTIVSDVPGRLRVRVPGRIAACNRGALTAVFLDGINGLVNLTLYPSAGSVAFFYDVPHAKEQLLTMLAALDAESIEAHKKSKTAQEYQQTHLLAQQGTRLPTGVGVQIFWQFSAYFARRVLLPTPLATLWTLVSFIPFARTALRALKALCLDVSVLDVASLLASFAQNDFTAAGQTMLLLQVGELLEEHTRRRSENELIWTLLERDASVFRVQEDRETEVLASEICPGNLVVVRTGMPIQVDGVVESGSAWVNQSSLTGEPYAIERNTGCSVFAGTVVEDGEIFVRVKAANADTRLRAITSLVERSEALKSQQQLNMEQLAQRVVPWNFALAGATWLLTCDFTRASAALMVDYSCVLKMGGSIAVLSAMRDGARLGFTVKGARFFEDYAVASTLVLDKTGTLTQARPELRVVIPVTLGAAEHYYDEQEVLRLAACLEEHFPHPLARAVVRAAAERGIDHRERHAKVEYLVAHGVVSSLEGRRVVIGSAHFVFEDEGVTIEPGFTELLENELAGLTPLYLAVDGVLTGVLGISDPLKEGAATVLEQLRDLGFSRIVMLTGDNARSAAALAMQLGIDEFYAELLPDEKHEIVAQIAAEGAKVVMVGDGVNDTPALARADVGISLGQGTAIAREVADITCASDALETLVTLRKLSCELKARLDFTSQAAVGFNGAVMAGGVLGALTPGTASLLHNSSTVALCLKNAATYAAH